MNRYLRLWGALALLLFSSPGCTGPSRCALEPDEARCRPTLEKVAHEDTHPRCSGLELRMKRVTGLMPLWVSSTAPPAYRSAWQPQELIAEPDGERLANAPESFTEFAAKHELKTFEEVWFHVSIATSRLPALPRVTFRIFDDANDGSSEGPARYRYSNALEVELGRTRTQIKFGAAQLKSPTRENFLLLADNPFIEHIGATSGRILYLRSGIDGFVKHKSFDRALVLGSSLLSAPFRTAPGNAVLHKDLLADFAADRVVYLEPRPSAEPQGMALINCPAALFDPTSCAVAGNLLDPETRAFALSKDATQAAIIAEDGQLWVATLSTVHGAMISWTPVVTPRPPSAARIWLRFVDVDGDLDEDLVAVYETFPQPFFVNVFRLHAGVYHADALRSQQTRDTLQVAGPAISTLTVGSLSPGSMHVAIVAGNTLTIFESQCGEPFLPTQTHLLEVPDMQDWVTGALAIADVSGDGRPDLILGYTTRFLMRDKYTQHLRVFVGP